MPRVASEAATLSIAAQGVRAAVIRLSPSVHGGGDHGFVPILIGIAREKRVSAYIGEGLNRWTAVHRLDAATLYRLALEKGAPGARYHGVAEEEIAFRDIAEAIGRHLNVPVVSKSPKEGGRSFRLVCPPLRESTAPPSSKLTQERLGWSPVHSTLLADLEQGTYFNS